MLAHKGTKKQRDTKRFFSSWRAILLGLSLLPVCSGEPAAAQKLSFVTSWIGNTYGNKNGVYVGNNADAMCVLPDGTIYTNTPWEEGGHEVGIYKNGEAIGHLPDTHGWGETGGKAIAADEKYVFVSMHFDTEGGGLKGKEFPPKGKVWAGIRRYTREGKHAPFPGGRGRFGDVLILHESDEKEETPILGMVCDWNGLLWVSDSADNKLLVLDSETLAQQFTVPLDHPAALTLDPEGKVAAISAPLNQPSFLQSFVPAGAHTAPVSLWKAQNITAIAFDQNKNLLVADAGSDQNIKGYRLSTSGRIEDPVLIGLMGEQGGLVGAKGKVAPLRFNQPVGIGCDAKGTLIVLSNGSASGGGMVLEGYASDYKTRLWELHGLEFVDCADTDPDAETEVYTKEEHFTLDYSRPVGKEATYRGYTLDRFRYPDDPRLHFGERHTSGTWVRRIGGRKFLVLNDMYSSALQIYRFESGSEIAIPSVLFAKEPMKSKDGYPQNQPAQGEYLWRDANGDGRMDRDEFLASPTKTNAPGAWGWWMDTRGDVWLATETQGIRHFVMQGFDKAGNPIYSYRNLEILPMPAPFNNLQRIEYDAQNDVMFLAGYTKARPLKGGIWKIVGRVICRYDHWSKGNCTAKWQIVLPWDVTIANKFATASVAKTVVAAMSVTGDYVFVVEARDGLVIVYDRNTGAKVGEMSPGAEVGGKTGWVDIPYGIRARQRKNGEYAVFVEEDAYGKVLLYKWRPVLKSSPTSSRARKPKKLS